MKTSTRSRHAQNTPCAPIKCISRGVNKLDGPQLTQVAYSTRRLSDIKIFLIKLAKKLWSILFKTKIDPDLLRQYQEENREKLAKYTSPFL